MGKVLIIGAGGVGTVVAHKVAQNPDVFTDIMIASRTKSKCDAIVKAIGNPAIKTAQVDADNVDELVELFNSFKPEIVINVALPYQDLTIMEACLKAGIIGHLPGSCWILPIMNRKMKLTSNTAGNGLTSNVLKKPA